MKKADEAFEQGDFQKALGLYLPIAKKQPQNSVVQYKVGVCYLKSKDALEQLKAFSYLENAKKHLSQETPKRLYHYLGRSYHLQQKFDEALAHYELFKKEAPANDKFQAENQRAIELSNNAKIIIANPIKMPIQNLGKPINTENAEFAPIISADESLLAYTFVSNKTGAKEQIFAAQKKNYEWTSTNPINFKPEKNVGTIGLSPDGQKMLIYIGEANNKGSIYQSQKSAKGWNEPEKLGTEINSGYMESTASISADGTVMYFASNRPGGFGGKDIYKVERQSDGSWGKATNLGETINTPYDEDAPFIHPDKKTLFFASEGHSSIGGSDIFKSILENGLWKKPENMGYPINTVFNDSYFVITANAKKAYFSSDRPNGAGKQDIYSIILPDSKNNALTMVKGKILAGNPPQPVPTQIKVIDKQTKEYLKYIYNPNPQTGDYLMIFPPGKNYDMIITAEGYLPYLVTINVPNQDYFYESYQEITLQKKLENGKEVGQEITIKNDFDPEKENPNNFQGRDLDLYDMMEDIIESEDSVALNYLLEVVYKNKQIDEKESQNAEEDAIQVTYMYTDENGQLVPYKVGDETIMTLKGIDTDDYSVNSGEIKLNKSYTAYFAGNSAQLDKRAIQEIKRFSDYMKQNSDVKVEILGYASSEGQAANNQKLSENRAKAVYDYFVSQGVDKNKITFKGFGGNASPDPEAAKRQMR
ncbi:MAG: OmpA family protein, partial [Thermonemataceae bacterium]|nr:OmpA family protein [Thermonemataceae bacterium]